MGCQVNRDLLPLKLFYFFFYGGTSSIVPFMPHYLRQKGFTPVDVTTILGVVPFVVVLTKPFIGHVTDCTRKFKPALFTTLGIGLVFMSLLMLLPSIPDSDAVRNHTVAETGGSLSNDHDVDNELLLDDATHNAALLDVYAWAPVQINASQETARRPVPPVPWMTSSLHYQRPEFWFTLVAIVLAHACGLSPSYTIVDALTMATLRAHDRHHDFGKQRLWMSVGMGCAMLIVALVMDFLKAHTHATLVDYTPSFVSFQMFLVAAIVTVHFMHTSMEATGTRDSTTQRRAGGLRVLLPVLWRPSQFAFLMASFLCGMNFGASLWLAVWYLKDLGAPQLTIGVCAIVVCISTGVTFLFSGQFIQHVGHAWTLCLILGVYSIRALVWSMITNSWFAVLNELLFGFCIGMWLANRTSYANAVSPKGSQMSGQALLSAIYDGLGVGVGNLVSGWLYQKYHGIATWRTMSLGTLLLLVLYCIFNLAFARSRPLLKDNKSSYTIVAHEMQPMSS